VRLWPALLLLAGCGGHPAVAVAPPQDSALTLATDSGRQSLEFGRLKQAVAEYKQAYTLAVARDDVQAIGDFGYNLAVAQLADDEASGALRTTLRTRDALAARTASGFAELDLVQSAALHRLGRDTDADRLAAHAQATAASAATVARASYVRGLIADKRGDAPGLSAALAGFGRPKVASADWEADHDDLMARLELLRGNYRKAASFAQRAADIHRVQLNYRAMASTLALAAEATRRAGSPQDAADLYLQAGDSAAARGDTASAARWLALAVRLGISPATRRVVQDKLSTLQKVSSR